MNQVTVGLAMLIAIGADGKSDRNHEFSSDFIPNSISLGRFRRNQTPMSQEKISAKVLYAIFATGILSFCGVAGETAMNITFPILMKEFEFWLCGFGSIGPRNGGWFCPSSDV